MRIEAGAWRSRTDKTGTRYFLHRLNGTNQLDQSVPPRRPGPETPRADADSLHRAYSALLAELSLSTAHRAALHRRGLTDAEIDHRGYRTLPVQGRARVARALRDRLGDTLLSVPGFIIKQGREERPYITVAGAAGLLVPIRDATARIVALLVRRDGARDGRGKYLYVSSASAGGPGPGSPAHLPLGVTAPCPTCRLTEGALKSDVATALSGTPTVGAAGLSWRPALDALVELGCKRVRLAFDADALDNPQVARALADCCEAANAASLTVELEQWDAADGKGIDDLLAAGKAPEILTGDAVRGAIAEALASATAGDEPDEPPLMERLRTALVDGAPAVFRDRELLEALARLSEEDPGEWACCRAAVQSASLRLRDLDAALAPHRQALRQSRPAQDRAACYRVSQGRIVRDMLTKDGAVEVPLANWSGRIVEEILRDDGAERQLLLAVEGTLADGTPLPRAEIAADRYPWMRWPVEIWGARAVVLAGASIADHLRCAVQLLSGDVPRRTVYGHTGWRRIGGAWLYLHAGGAIGPDGPAPGIEVALPEPLAGLALREPPWGTDLVRAVRASLALLDGLAPDRIMFPLLGGVYRAALGDAPGPIDLSIHLVGEHGAGKSELAALCQQHYGAGLDRLHLPGNWLSTGNAMEGIAFAAKDALLVVDDYAPAGAQGGRQRLEREADRLLRAQGNRSGRQRMRIDGSLRPPKPPRGLILSTGEDVPPGQSLRGRTLVPEVSKKDGILARLTPHQHAAAAGLFAQAMAGFVCWLSPQYGELCKHLPNQQAAFRNRVLAEITTESPRTPGVVANLALGLKLFLEFGQAVGAITEKEREALAQRGWRALMESAIAHGAHLTASEPTGRFFRLLAAALASGRAHMAGPDGQRPDAPDAWGWRSEVTRDGLIWRPQGRRIGWIDGSDIYLEPVASYAEAHELSRQQGEELAVSRYTLTKRLKDEGLLVSWDAQRQRTTVRRTLGGTKCHEVLHLRADALSPTQPSKPSTGLAEAEETQRAMDGFGGRSDDPPAKPSTETVHQNGQEQAQKPAGGRFGRSNTGGEASPSKNSADEAEYGPYRDGF